MQSRDKVAKLAAAMGGLPVMGCLPGSPTEQAGIRYGDVLLSIDGKPTATWDDFIEARGACGAGFTARLFRDGAEFDVHIELLPVAREPLEILNEIVAAETDGEQ